MRDDHLKQIEELKDKTNHTKQIDEVIFSPPMIISIFTSRSNIELISLVNNK
jgi:hypothetical protein